MAVHAQAHSASINIYVCVQSAKTEALQMEI